MSKHALLAICFLGILILIVSVPSVMAHPVIIGTSVNEIPHDHPPNEYEYSEIVCDLPDPTGLCYKPVPGGNTTTQTGFTTEATVTGIGIVGGIVVLIVLGAAIAVTVYIIFGKDISKFIKKH